jgi:peptidoglycan/xylan/chitin deacetylase (PgdA/CDA1 family)
MSIRHRLLLATIWQGLVLSAGAQTVSLTLDDGPRIDPTPLMTPAERNEAILRHLRDKGVQAMFFVTLNNGADRPEGLALLKRLSDGGQLIANHTVTHPDFNAETTSLDAFEQEILACDGVIRALPGYRKLLRFPFLREGAADAKRDGIRAFLREQGYRIGYVSIDTSDWVVDQKLRQALASNPALELTAWRELHLAGLWDNAQAYERLARQLYGREVKHVLLLHHNLVNALFLGDMIDMFRSRGWTIVSPDAAFADPAYQVAPMIPRLDGSVLGTTAQALGVELQPALAGLRSERRLGEDADRLIAPH